VLLSALVVLQPSAHLARADEPAPPLFAVVGVACATLRAEPNGASAALAIVPAGGVVALAGPDVVTEGVRWRQVRTAEGTVGFLPAGLLAPLQGSPAGMSGPAAAEAAPAAPGPAPAPSVGSAAQVAPAQSAPAQSVGAAPPAVAEAGPPPARAQLGAAGDGGTSSGVVSSGVASGTARQATPSPEPAPTPVRPAAPGARGPGAVSSVIQRETAPDGRPMGAGRIVVGFKPGASEPARADAHRAAGASSTTRTGVPDVVVAQVPPGTVPRALAAYRSRPDVAWAEPDYVRRATFATNDPQLGSQWGPQKIGAPTAWDVTTGSTSIKIAILDCGIYSESSPFPPPDNPSLAGPQRGHPDLRGKIDIAADEKNFTPAGDVDDHCNHGTLMAGIAAANTNNGIGVAGVGFNTHLINGKVLDDSGSGFDSWIASGMVWAADKGAAVISMSLGGDGPCSATLQAAADYAWGKGAVIVAAAGNGGTDGIGDPAPEAPGSCNHVIPVGSIEQDDTRSSFSNYGPAVPLAAPGRNVLSTDTWGVYDVVSGTSPATPHVAAVAALVKAVSGQTNQWIVNRLTSMADPIAGTGSIWASGRVDAAAAVGPSSCSPRPPVGVATIPTGSQLNVVLTASGVGNALRFVQVGGSAGAATNAAVTFPGPTSDAGGTTTYVPSTVATTVSFTVKRQTAGLPTTVPLAATDGCGTWKSFVGGGPSAGF
jgi:thermitase